ncbi:MAG: leucine-rich repeat domain-containing protein [Ruminococcaceae bacterium]|nr:leucine-rich repeat domain-containing protein [Oscillospiraceae bacterium]
MKRTCKALSVLLTLCLLLGLAPTARAEATSGACGDDLTWAYFNGTLTISGAGAMTDYSSIFDVPWYDISGKITSVVIKNGCTHIGRNAFDNLWYLKSVTLPEDGGLESIGRSAFEHCQRLESITLPNGLTTIGTWAFASCRNLKNITIPEGVAVLGSSVFQSCGKLTSVALPASLEKLDTSAFAYCYALAEFKLAPGSEDFCVQDGVLFSRDMTTLIAYPCGRTGQDGKPMTSYSIPDDVQTVGANAFYNAVALSSVSIPGSVTKLGDNAFVGTALTSVKLPEGLTTIGRYAFSSCKSIESVVIPGSVTSVGEGAFAYCTALRYAIVQRDTPAIGDYAFSGCTELSWIAIPSTVTRIGGGAFNSCAALEDVYYAGAEDEWNAVEGRNVLWRAAIHCGADCGTCGTDLKWLLNEGTLHIFGEGAMTERPWLTAHKSDITAVDVASGVTGIVIGAFNGCSNLKYIILPASVTDVGRLATGGCTGLTDVYYGGDLTSWYSLRNNLPMGNNPLENAKVHCNTTGPWTAITAVPWEQMIDWCAVQNVPEGAVLIAARYDGEGCMTGVWTHRFDSAEDYWKMESIIPDGEGDEFMLILVDGETFAPLCGSWDNISELPEPEWDPEEER